MNIRIKRKRAKVVPPTLESDTNYKNVQDTLLKYFALLGFVLRGLCTAMRIMSTKEPHDLPGRRGDPAHVVNTPVVFGFSNSCIPISKFYYLPKLLLG